MRGYLMRTFTLAYPTMRRLNLLHASFSRTIQQCLQAARPPLSKVSPPRPGRPPRHSRTAARAAEVLPARVSQAAMDSLYNELLQLDQAAGRCVACQALLLSIFLSQSPEVSTSSIPARSYTAVFLVKLCCVGGGCGGDRVRCTFVL